MQATLKEKIHPYKFSMWIGIASMSMFFAGLTSAYVVRNSQSKWLNVAAPKSFLLATLVIFLSSITLHFAIQNFKKNKPLQYQFFLLATLILGLLFMALQMFSFYTLFQNGISLSSHIAGSFIYLIASMHLLHALGGVIALVLVYVRLQNKWRLTQSAMALEVLALYWHFVDLVWIYLIVFYFFMLS